MLTKQQLRHCPQCGSRLAPKQHDGQLVPICQNKKCNYIFWQNAKPCTAVLIADDEGRVLMGLRAIEPDVGKLDLPGGFLHEAEEPEVGAKRESAEELGVEINIIEILGFSVDHYGDTGIYTLNIGFVADIVAGTPKAADDIDEIVWVDPKLVKKEQLAFNNTGVFLKRWNQRN